MGFYCIVVTVFLLAGIVVLGGVGGESGRFGL